MTVTDFSNIPASEIQDNAYTYIRRYLIETIRDNEINGNLKFQDNNIEPANGPFIILQIWYNKDTHKVFVEYDLNYTAEVKYNTARVKEIFEDKMRRQFHYDTYLWYEILNPEDGVHENCDSNALPTPYTIGYWKSLSGRYEFVEDDTEVYADATNYLNPSDEIVSGFPVKRFYGPAIGENQSWYSIVKGITDRYKQVFLTEAQKDDYIRTVNQYGETYGRDSETYRTKVNQLNASLGIKTNVSNSVPQMFTEYNAAYTDFFGRSLNHNIESEKKRMYLEIIGKEKTKRYGNGI